MDIQDSVRWTQSCRSSDKFSRQRISPATLWRNGGAGVAELRVYGASIRLFLVLDIGNAELCNGANYRLAARCPVRPEPALHSFLPDLHAAGHHPPAAIRQRREE